MMAWLDADFDRHGLVAWGAFVVSLGLAWRPWLTARAGRRGEDILFGGMLFFTLLAFRWPVFFLPETLNIDESQMISGAMTLRHDPVFWRSVEGQTIGPLDYYALVPVTFLKGTNAYFGPRLLALLLSWIVVVMGYRTARLFYAEKIARASVLPLLAFFALTTDAHFVAYLSEAVPIAIVAVALFCLAKSGRDGRGAWAFAAGAALAAAPLAKLQVGPLVAWIFACGVIWGFVRSREGKAGGAMLGLLVAGAASVCVLIGVMAVLGGVWADMRISYFEANLFYVDENREGVSRLRVWREILLTMGRNESFRPLLVAAVAVAMLAIAARCRPDRDRRWLLWLGAGGWLAGVACALLGSRNYAHYFLLQTPALGLLTAWALGSLAEANAASRSRWLALACAVNFGAGIAWPALTRLHAGSPYAGQVSVYRAMGDGRPSAAIDELKRWVKPGEPLAVWGWEPSLYLRTGTWQATRDPSTRRLVEPSGRRDYFRARYLSDLEKNRPRVLVDMTAARRRGFGFEGFPEFGAYLEKNFRLVAEVESRRIYVRRDAAPLVPSP